MTGFVFRRVVVISLCIGLLAPPRARSETDPNSDRFLGTLRELRRTLTESDQPLTGVELERTFRNIAGAVQSRSALADLLEHAGVKVSFQLEGGLYVFGGSGFQGTASTSFDANNSEGAISLTGPKGTNLKAGVQLGAQTVSASIQLPQPITVVKGGKEGTGISFSPTFSVDFHYANTADFLTLIGLSADAYPGGKMVKDLVRYALGKHAQGPDQLPLTTTARSYAGVTSNVLTELGRVFSAQYFDAASKFDEFTYGTGLKWNLPNDTVTNPTPLELEIEIVQKHRKRLTAAASPEVTLSEVSVCVGLGGDYGIPARGTPETPVPHGKLSVEVTYSNDPESIPSSDQLEFAREVRAVGLEAAALRFFAAATYPVAHWQTAGRTIRDLTDALVGAKATASPSTSPEASLEAVHRALAGSGSPVQAARLLASARVRLDDTARARNENPTPPSEVNSQAEVSKAGKLIVYPPESITWRGNKASLDVILSGSGENPEEVASQSWGPAAQVTAFNDPSRQIVVEVAAAGWATDGLERYLRPPQAIRDMSTHVAVDVGDKTAVARVEHVLSTAVRTDAPTAVIVEATARTPEQAVQNDTVARLVSDVVQNHMAAHPDAPRTIYAQGSASKALSAIATALQAAERASVLGTFNNSRIVAVSPIGPIDDMPDNAAVILHRDSRFHNYDPGSPSYERLVVNARALARKSDVLIVGSEGDGLNRASHWSKTEFVGKSTTKVISLSSLSSYQALQAWSNGTDANTSISAAEALHKPSTVGGISLVTSATLPIDGRTIVQASYNTGDHRIVIKAADGTLSRLPAIDPEFARIAWECLYQHGVAPELSIGSDPHPNVTEIEQIGRSHVYYVGAIENTRAGAVMLAADRLLADITFGDADAWNRFDLVPGAFHTLAEMYPARYGRGLDAYRHLGGRVFLIPSQVSLVETQPGEFSFAHVTFDIRLDPSGPAEAAFSESVAQNWSAITASRSGRPFAELAEFAKAVSLFVWLHDSAIPFDNSFDSISPSYYVTSTDVPLLERPSLTEPMNSALPLSVYSDDGLKEVYLAPGKVTALTYQDGNVASVSRYDGARLVVYRDSLGAPAAVSVSPEGVWGAFGYDAKAHGAVFYDRVHGRFVGDQFVGFDRTATTRTLYGVNPEDVVTRIIAAFIVQQ